MSQVTFWGTDRTGQRVEVLAGWDEPMRWFFLVVFNTDGETLYTNLDHPAPAELGRDTRAFRHVLQTRGVDAPEGFWERVERREGNGTRHAFREGRWA